MFSSPTYMCINTLILTDTPKLKKTHRSCQTDIQKNTDRDQQTVTGTDIHKNTDPDRHGQKLNSPSKYKIGNREI